MSVKSYEETIEIISLGDDSDNTNPDSVLTRRDDSPDSDHGEFIHSFTSKEVIVVKI